MATEKTFSDAELERIKTIEKNITSLWVAIGNLTPKKQYNALMLLKQQEIDSLTRRIEALESQLTTLQKQIG